MRSGVDGQLSFEVVSALTAPRHFLVEFHSPALSHRALIFLDAIHEIFPEVFDDFVLVAPDHSVLALVAEQLDLHEARLALLAVVTNLTALQLKLTLVDLVLTHTTTCLTPALTSHTTTNTNRNTTESVTQNY